jgi:hypothetical protein
VVLLEYIGIDQLVLLSSLKVHAVVIAELLLHVLEVLIQENFLEDTDNVVKLVVLYVLA